MKVVLLNPPDFHILSGSAPELIEDTRGFSPPLGLLYLASYSLKHSDHEIVIIDALAEQLKMEDLEQRLLREAPEVIGITTLTFTLIDVMACVKLAKTLLPNVKIILGGAHVHLFREETINLPGVDYLVLGEGEITFTNLLAHINDPAAIRKIPGIVFRENGQTVCTGEPVIVDDLDALPHPARQLINPDNYSSLLLPDAKATTIFTSRGCPFRCNFCNRPRLDYKFRARSAENVVEEIKECVEMGITTFIIHDDTFTLNSQRAEKICDLIIQQDLKICFDIRARVDTVTAPLLQKLKQAGCLRINYGLESGTQKILDNLNKGTTLEKIRKAVEITKDAGIQILGYFMIGNPGETRADIKETFAFIQTLNLDYSLISILTPYPGTEVYNDARRKGIIKKDIWQEFAADPKPGFVLPVLDNILSAQELNELSVNGYRSFYLSPKFILRQLLQIRSFGELKRKFIAGLHMLRLK